MKRLLFVILLASFTASACAQPSLTVGSKRFPESEILGEMVTQIANATGEASRRRTS